MITNKAIPRHRARIAVFALLPVLLFGMLLFTGPRSAHAASLVSPLPKGPVTTLRNGAKGLAGKPMSPSDFEPLCLLTAATAGKDFTGLYGYYWHLNALTINQCSYAVYYGEYSVDLTTSCYGFPSASLYDSFRFSENPLGKAAWDKTQRYYFTSKCILHGYIEPVTVHILIFSTGTSPQGQGVASDTYQFNISFSG